MIKRIFTIGAYGHSREEFFASLRSNNVDALVDIRQRRGMRGKRYSFLNSIALQSELRTHAIGYRYIKELAPTTAIRDAQRAADAGGGTTKRERRALSDEFNFMYKAQVLDKCDAAAVLRQLEPFDRICFFCVERTPSACHRSLVSAWLSLKLGVDVLDIGAEMGQQ